MPKFDPEFLYFPDDLRAALGDDMALKTFLAPLRLRKVYKRGVWGRALIRALDEAHERAAEAGSPVGCQRRNPPAPVLACPGAGRPNGNIPLPKK